MKHLRITVEGTAYDVTVEDLDAGQAPSAPVARPAAPVAAAPAPAPVAAAPVAAPAPAAAPAGAGDVPCPLAGTVDTVEVSVGQKVNSGDTLVVLEAMKMKTPIGAPMAGTISAVNVAPGATVTEGQVLVSIS